MPKECVNNRWNWFYITKKKTERKYANEEERNDRDDEQQSYAITYFHAIGCLLYSFDPFRNRLFPIQSKLCSYKIFNLFLEEKRRNVLFLIWCAPAPPSILIPLLFARNNTILIEIRFNGFGVYNYDVTLRYGELKMKENSL